MVGAPDTVSNKRTEISKHLHPGYPHISGNAGPMLRQDVRHAFELFGRDSSATGDHASTLRVSDELSTGCTGAPG
jgi:hypothetical protein